MYPLFDEVLFRRCYWNFISLTTLSDAACEQALEELIKAEIADAHSMNKAFRKWFQKEGGIQWEDPQYSFRVGNVIRNKPGTVIQQIDVIASAITHLYAFSWVYRKSIEDGITLDIDRKAYVEARFDCKHHKDDSGKLITPRIYTINKPFGQNVDCKCGLRWESLRAIRKAKRMLR